MLHTKYDLQFRPCSYTVLPVIKSAVCALVCLGLAGVSTSSCAAASLDAKTRASVPAPQTCLKKPVIQPAADGHDRAWPDQRSTRSLAPDRANTTTEADQVFFLTGGDTPPSSLAARLGLINKHEGAFKGVKIDYPPDASVFPPDITAPWFLWHDSQPDHDLWLIEIQLSLSRMLYVLTRAPVRPPAQIDKECLGPTNEIYRDPYKESARSWKPDTALWQRIKKASNEHFVTFSVFGFTDGDAGPGVLSKASIQIKTSRDPVGAPIFYRDVPLMPSAGKKGIIAPLKKAAYPLILWRLRDVGRAASRIVMKNLPTCSNCHSFSSDGSTIAMDLDGPQGDKGAYAIAQVKQETVIGKENVISWNSFPDKPPGHKTIGFLSRVSPDGHFVVSTLNEEVFVCNFTDYRFLQVFYPTRGILAWYSLDSREMKKLAGADDPAWVHCSPCWTPDGNSIVFCRARARPSYGDDFIAPARAGDPGETPIRYGLYRIAFNNGAGGTARPIRGAVDNGYSNTFPKVSPDGKWIVFVRCRNGLLMRPDSELWIVPLDGGTARRMNCNLPLMNSWHSFSPNGRWLVFSSKADSPYTRMYLTHIDENGVDSPAIRIDNATAANRAVNIPEFVNIDYEALKRIRTPALEAFRLYESAVKLVEEKLPEKAIDCLEEFLEKEPGHAKANLLLAGLYIDRGQLRKARSLVMRAKRTLGGHDDPTLFYNLGRIDYARKNYAAAAEAFRHALRINPAYADAHYFLGRCCSFLGKYYDSIFHYNEALEIQPDHVGALTARASAHLARGLAGRAAEDFEKAGKVCPDNRHITFALANALYEDHQDDKALSICDSLRKNHPEWLEAINLTALLYVRKRRFEEAARLFSAIVRIKPENPEYILNLARCLFKMNESSQGLVAMQRACQLAPGRIDLLIEAGDRFAENGQPGPAAAYYSRALHQARLDGRGRLVIKINRKIRALKKRR